MGWLLAARGDGLGWCNGRVVGVGHETDIGVIELSPAPFISASGRSLHLL